MAKKIGSRKKRDRKSDNDIWWLLASSFSIGVCIGLLFSLLKLT